MSQNKLLFFMKHHSQVSCYSNKKWLIYSLLMREYLFDHVSLLKIFLMLNFFDSFVKDHLAIYLWVYLRILSLPFIYVYILSHSKFPRLSFFQFSGLTINTKIWW
jgi:hypothetical protein